ncbi:uncharacterized protein [Drosophila virilis]|uniref:Uncharacterized protein, isoform I n=1 Tax=Drosophila virilis TaxID=7244 RepID=A0A0Q9WGE3_DROVI|nr:uncharacterized protein LOC6625339 isoform X14 [Drosophila virilis]KRF80110.1 uncharacterized protein Dvir_GJ20211, isoform I [Drosophila virilis]
MLGALLISLLLFVLSIFFYACALTLFVRKTNRNRRRDRQNNVELGRQHNRFGDIFYIEPNSQEAARIREQLEKDDKELPSYDEVMRMCNLTTPTAAAALPTPTMESSAIGIAALPAPPYSECDPHLNVETPAATNAVTASTLEPSPSTSRAAQIPT